MNFKSMGLIPLLNQLKLEVLKGDDQELINEMAIEIANRMYVDGITKQTYEELLDTLGYKDEKKKVKRKNANNRSFK